MGLGPITEAASAATVAQQHQQHLHHAKKTVMGSPVTLFSPLLPQSSAKSTATVFALTLCFSMLLLFLTTASNRILNDNAASAMLSASQLPPATNAFPQRQENQQKPKDIVVVDWVSVAPDSNFTSKYLELIAQNGSKPCHDIPTHRTELIGLPQQKDGEPYPTFRTGYLHELTLISYDANGSKRCLGGDYFETDLLGSNWKSRPPITDNSDGSYSIKLQVHPRFSGVYKLKVILMFTNYHGLHRRPERWFRNETVVDLPIRFIQDADNNSSVNVPTLRQCQGDDFKLDSWTGRWVRSKYNRRCTVNKQGRFICIDRNSRCDEPWCRGSVGRLESNGWVYSAHCAFRVFTEDVAWNCLNKKWLFFWGDSNHVDSIRNFLNFVLGFENITEVPRRFDMTFHRPSNPGHFVRITSMFNGHSNVSLNHEGLFSLNSSAFQEQIVSFFNGSRAPDVVIMNSGLHDGMYWKHLHHFVEQGVDRAVAFWSSLLNGVNGKKPKVIYRTTIATAAWARAAAFNPHKMEVFNHMFVEKLKQADLLWGVVDGFDITYPWHYDNNCSDGVHYGKPPAATNWYGQIGHQYFVDLMLIHTLLHAICID